MKKLMFSIATLVVLAGSTFSAIPAVHSNTTMAGVTNPKTGPKPGPAAPDSIPPGCPLNDPNGCGIFN